MSEALPEELLRFLYACVDSIEELQVLILLYERPHERPNEHWTIETLSSELRSSVPSISKRLRDLSRKRVLQARAIAEKEIRYLPFSPEVARIVEQVAQYYKTYPYRVIEAIFSKPTNTLHTLADAFRFKKDEE